MIEINITGKPSIELVRNYEGSICASLMDWDISEMEDSYTLEEVNELILALENAKSAMMATDENQMKFTYGDE